MYLTYPNRVYYQIKQKKKSKKRNTKNAYKKKKKLRSEEIKQMRQDKYFFSTDMYEQDITIHSKNYYKNNQIKMNILLNPDLMNIILSYVSFRTYIILSMVCKDFNKLFKEYTYIFLSKKNRNYWAECDLNMDKMRSKLNHRIFNAVKYKNLIKKNSFFFNSQVIHLCFFDIYQKEKMYLVLVNINKLFNIYIDNLKYCNHCYKNDISCKKNKFSCKCFIFNDYLWHKCHFTQFFNRINFGEISDFNKKIEYLKKEIKILKEEYYNIRNYQIINYAERYKKGEYI